MTLFSVARFLAATALAWILWRIVLTFFRKSPLDNIPGPSPHSFWTGSFRALFDPQGWDFHHNLAQKYGGVVRIDGPMRSKMLYVFDPLALYHIIVKDQPIFSRNHVDILVSHLMFGEGLLSVGSGTQHRRQRKMLNPVFNILHLRSLTPVFYAVAHKLRTGLTSKVINGPVEVIKILSCDNKLGIHSIGLSQIDVLHWMSRCALELIGQGGLGYSFDNLMDSSGEAGHPYSEALSGMEPLLIHLNLATRFILPWASKIGTARFRRTVVDWVPWKALHEFRDMLDVMNLTTRQIFEEKKRAINSGMIEKDGGKDIMSILRKLAIQKEDRLPDEEVLGQMSTLIFAATETTSTALAHILYLLAQNPDVQDRLRAELTEAQETIDGDIPYDALMQLSYLEAPSRTSCSHYLLLTIVMAHRTLADTVLPLATPLRGYDGTEMHALHIPRGTNLMLSVHNANRAPTVWGPDAAEWKPARWLGPLPETVVEAPATGVYRHLYEFQSTLDMCRCGFKFAQLEMSTCCIVFMLELLIQLTTEAVLAVILPRVPRFASQTADRVESWVHRDSWRCGH
ncbi:Cytochrome p450 [Mycena venus]|uniref:Cytochrome p450 n=1 Tax=Mycena venus TaxID=2733690 RepID=A0A8H7D8A3_9AGAR|nr:Cytochrome p450 [Mycena venus]